MDTQTTKKPYTMRELADAAEKLGITPSEALEVFGPWPTPPSGYTMAPKSDSRWIGTETMARGWIITPAWNARTGEHSLELWMANHKAPDYAVLTPADALQLAADLASAAKALEV